MTSYAHWQSHFCHIEFPYYIIFFEKKTLRFRGFFNTFSIGGGRSCNRLLCHNEKTKHENLLAGYRRRYDVLQAAVEHRSSTIIETAAILLKLQTAGNVYKSGLHMRLWESRANCLDYERRKILVRYTKSFISRVSQAGIQVACSLTSFLVSTNIRPCLPTN